MNHSASIEQMRKRNEALARGEAVRLGDTVWDTAVAKYHGRRDDGVFTPLYIDDLADADFVARAMTELRAEAKRLRSAGHQVL